MAEPDKRPVAMEELLVSSLAQTDALTKLLIAKGPITRESSCRRFRGTGDVSEGSKSDATVKIGKTLIWESSNLLLLKREYSF
jgi:hypothetical protein